MDRDGSPTYQPLLFSLLPLLGLLQLGLADLFQLALIPSACLPSEKKAATNRLHQLPFALAFLFGLHHTQNGEHALGIVDEDLAALLSPEASSRPPVLYPLS